MNSYLLVFLGGGIGSMLRLGVYRLARLWLAPDFPWGTLAVNVIGGFAAGLVIGWLAGRSTGGADNASLFLMTGVLGGFTTFSAFSIDTLLLMQRGQIGGSLVYVSANVGFSIAAAAIGFALLRTLATN